MFDVLILNIIRLKWSDVIGQIHLSICDKIYCPGGCVPKNGTAKNKNGTAKNKNGTAKNKNGTAKNKNGTAISFIYLFINHAFSSATYTMTSGQLNIA